MFGTKNPLKLMLGVILITFFSAILLSPSIVHAQESKPKLAEIVLNDKNSDTAAEEIVEKIYNNWIEKNNSDLVLGEINAKFLQIAKKGSNDKFIFSILYGEDFGGCYNRGCKTILLHSSGENKWSIVFNAFVHNSFYDINSNVNRHANLIFSSNIDNSNPGLWFWDGIAYEVVNKQ